MTDGWQRPDRPIQPTVEIPLTGSGPLATSADGDRSEPPPNWRKIVGLASLGGVVGGIVLSVVLIGFVWDDDDPGGGIGGDPQTTLDSELVTEISTPPTLARLDPVPATTIDTEPTGTPPSTLVTPAITTAPASGGPQTFGTLPLYPRSTGVPAGGLDSFDLDLAIAKLSEDVPRRSSTHIETGDADNTIEVTIVRDPSNNRYGIEYTGLGGVQDIVVDIDGGTTYFTVDQLNWTAIPNGEVIPDIAAADLGAYFDRMMLGPVRPDTLAAATVEPGSTVFFEGVDTVAREFDVELPGAVVPEWQFYAFSPISTLPAELRPETLNYRAYVDDNGDLNRVIGTAPIEDAAQLVVHRIEPLDEPENVLLPDPALVSPSGEASG